MARGLDFFARPTVKYTGLTVLPSRNRTPRTQSLVPKYCSTQSYVDDTKLLLNFRLKDQRDTVSKMNEDLQRICQWTFTNKLLLNPDKTKLVIFGSRKLGRKIEGLHLSLLGKELTPAESAKDLGVILDLNLTYEDHITKTVSTCMSRLGQINRVKHVLDKDTLTIIVNCLVFSKLFYCSNVWSNTTESNLDKVQKVHNFACRIISGVKKFDHITPVLRAMQWLPIRQQLYYRNAVMAFNCMTGRAPDRLTDQFIKRSDVSTRTTRNSQKLQIPCNWTEILLLQDCKDLECAGSLAQIKQNTTRIQTKIKEHFIKRLHGQYNVT